MTDYSEQGAIPVEDAAVPNPPTVDEVLARQRELEGEGSGSGDDPSSDPAATSKPDPASGGDTAADG